MINSPSRKSPAKTYVDYISGPIKIKDGLYMGDEIAAKVLAHQFLGHGLYHKQQGDAYNKYCGEEGPELV